jgi:hypothetical protein
MDCTFLRRETSWWIEEQLHGNSTLGGRSSAFVFFNPVMMAMDAVRK